MDFNLTLTRPKFMCTLCFVSDLKTHVARDLPVSELRKPSCQEHRPFLLILKHSYEKKAIKYSISIFFLLLLANLKDNGYSNTMYGHLIHFDFAQIRFIRSFFLILSQPKYQMQRFYIGDVNGMRRLKFDDAYQLNIPTNLSSC